VSFSFAQSVVNAIEGLHHLGFAHMDIRLPNICFDHIDGSWQAVLIDLDNACELTYPCEVYTDSIMYCVQIDKIKNYDWRQFAIMLARIIESSDDNYHTKGLVFKDNPFEQELKCSFIDGTKPNLDGLEFQLVF